MHALPAPHVSQHDRQESVHGLSGLSQRQVRDSGWRAIRGRGVHFMRGGQVRGQPDLFSVRCWDVLAHSRRHEMSDLQPRRVCSGGRQSMRGLPTGNLFRLAKQRTMPGLSRWNFFQRKRAHDLPCVWTGILRARKRIGMHGLLAGTIQKCLRGQYLPGLRAGPVFHRGRHGLPVVPGGHVCAPERHGNMPGLPEWHIRNEWGLSGA